MVAQLSLTNKNIIIDNVVTYNSDGEPLSYLYDDKWSFIGMQKAAPGQSLVVSFSKTDPRFKNSIQEILFQIIKYHEAEYNETATFSMVNRWKKGFQKIAECLDSTEWSKLDSDLEYRQFKRKLLDMKLTLGSIKEAYTPLSKLYHIGHIKRFIHSHEITSLAKSKITKQAIAIPMRMYSEILKKAIEVVELYHPYRNEIADVMKLAYDTEDKVRNSKRIQEESLASNPNSKKGPLDKNKAILNIIKSLTNKFTHNIPNFDINLDGSQLNKIQTACIIVVLAFSGVRRTESLSFNTESFSFKEIANGKNVAILSGVTTKGNDGIPITVNWQTHPIVLDALQLAQVTTQPLREIYKVQITERFNSNLITKDEYLNALSDISSAFISVARNKGNSRYVFNDSGKTSRLTKFMIDYDIRSTPEDIAEFDLLNPGWAGSLLINSVLPRLSNHDFRRTFAVFFSRYGFGTASGIKFQYKHKNINMANYYLNNVSLSMFSDITLDMDLLEILQSEAVAFGVDVYDEIYNKSLYLSGTQGISIANEKIKKTLSEQDIYMTRGEIERLIKNGDISIVQLPTGGYCTNPSCERLCSMGLFAVEDAKCSFRVNTDITAQKISQQRLRLIDQFSGLNDGDKYRNSILVALKQRILDMEVILHAHKIDFVNFNSEIKGLLNDN